MGGGLNVLLRICVGKQMAWPPWGKLSVVADSYRIRSAGWVLAGLYGDEVTGVVSVFKVVLGEDAFRTGPWLGQLAILLSRHFGN